MTTAETAAETAAAQAYFKHEKAANSNFLDSEAERLNITRKEYITRVITAEIQLCCGIGSLLQALREQKRLALLPAQEQKP